MTSICLSYVLEALLFFVLEIERSNQQYSTMHGMQANQQTSITKYCTLSVRFHPLLSKIVLHTDTVAKPLFIFPPSTVYLIMDETHFEASIGIS